MMNIWKDIIPLLLVYTGAVDLILKRIKKIDESYFMWRWKNVDLGGLGDVVNLHRNERPQFYFRIEMISFLVCSIGMMAVSIFILNNLFDKATMENSVYFLFSYVTSIISGWRCVGIWKAWMN